MEQGRLQTLDRGLTVLRLLAESADGLKIAALAERLGVHRAIAYRIVNTLADHGMVHRLAGGRIVLGSGALLLGARAEGNLRALARPVVEALAERAGATAFLSVAQGEDGVAVLTAEPRDTFLNIHYRVGTRHPLSRGAAGIAILAGRPPQDDDPEPVRRARADGYSLTRGELQAGAVGVSSPVPLSREAYPTLECSLGVVALDGLDIDRAVAAVPAAAAELAAQLAG
ncbi:IclR family transcriptional regulator [Acidimangrovimonas pyrenivorans]|uniref:IclR family transcriptional regulator n=1 Tax=Acidimangrovimonas pyrenivorans TaxID=2030798 RepID=A0ABV7AM14_9RHOB